MTNDSKVLDTSVNIKAEISDVWQLLTNKEIVEKITSLTVRGDINIKADKGNGVLTIGKGIFFINYTPYDIALNGTQAKIRIQLMELSDGCCAMVACLVPENSILDLNKERLEKFFSNLKMIAESYSQNEIPSDNEEKLEKGLKQLQPDVHRRKEQSVEEKSVEKKVRIKRERAYLGPIYHEESGFSNNFGRRILAIILLLFMLSTIVLATFIRYLKINDNSQFYSLSSSVNLKNAKDISFGEKRNQISYLFNTNGTSIDDNHVVYASALTEGERKPSELIMIEYSSSYRVKAVSYLNLAVASKYYNIKTFDAQLSYDMTIDEAVKEVGIPFSLYRRYFDRKNNYIEEIHFGYLDPTANFNEAWRGEFEVIFNRTKETLVIKNWGPYDGSDPSMRGSIENTSFANQYDNYTDFLNDRFQFSRSQLLLNRYSLGDTKFFFDGEPVHYSDNFGYHFYSIDSDEKLDDSETPLYRISIGYDNKGGFQMASFSNMRLYNKGGTLKDTHYRLLSRGMTYNEVRSLMNLIPTSIYIDADFYSICYGRFLDTEVTDEQFEVIVRFGIEDNIAHRVLINAAVSEVTDSEKNS